MRDNSVMTEEAATVVVPTVASSTSPVEVDEPIHDTDLDLDRPWVVIVWNDPINLMDYVTFVFQKLFGYSLEKATSLMLDVHEKGRASVSTGACEEGRARRLPAPRARPVGHHAAGPGTWPDCREDP